MRHFMQIPLWCALLFALLIGPTITAPVAKAVERPVTVFAAASLKTALDLIIDRYADQTGQRPVAAYASSSALARQIEAGAPADLFLSADLDWMDYLAQRGLIAADSRVDLLGNRLVLIVPTQGSVPPGAADAEDGTPDPRPWLGKDGRLAVALTESVPVGRYAKAALISQGLWPSLQDRLAPAENARAALALVARREAPAGIVYATDAAAEPAVRVVALFPVDSHPAIIYPAALLKGGVAPATDFLAFLRSAPAAAIFRAQGFTVLAPIAEAPIDGAPIGGAPRG